MALGVGYMLALLAGILLVVWTAVHCMSPTPQTRSERRAAASAKRKDKTK
jgi:hypothetical protein